MSRKISYGDENHSLDWLDEFPAVEKSVDPEIRKAIEALELR